MPDEPMDPRGNSSQHEITLPPGQAPACLDERDARHELAEAQGKLIGEIASIRDDLGTEATRQRPGTGIRGTLSTILDRLDTLTEKVDELAKSKSTPPSAPQKTVVTQVATWLVILFLAASQARTMYQSLTSPQAPQLPTTGQKP